MVDFFLLILIPGSGDELQGIKKGVMEISDMIAINKADGDNIQYANITKASYQQAVGMLSRSTDGWNTIVKTFSALENKGISDIWTDINYFIDLTKQNGAFDKRRNEQVLYWVKSMVEEELMNRFYNNITIENILPAVNKDVLSGKITPTNAVSLLLNTYFENKN
jgi:LAO/AO transport system kinase